MILLVECVAITLPSWKQPQKIGHFWTYIFNDYVEAVKNYHLFQLFRKKMFTHPTPIHPIFDIGPFAKWGLFFMTCHLASIIGNKYIIVVVDYFMKWVKAMPPSLLMER